jgi:DNA-binding NarL/FixJ family response regulator
VAPRIERETAWPVIGLTAAALLGAVIGTTALPQAWPVVAAATLAQLAATALGLAAPRWPVLWAVAVAVVSLGSVLPDPRLSELAYSGATPWIGLSAAMAALNLYRRADDWIGISAGSAALALGSAGVVAVGVRAGTPIATAVTAASVPFLIGVIIALGFHLRDARDDRVRRAELAVESLTADAADATGGTLQAARRALAIVALRSDELVASTPDAAARRAAADLREVARRGLTGTGLDTVAHIEVRPAAPPDARAPEVPPPMPHLPEREREILRLVATGASNAAIGRSLYLSEATVKQYVSRLMRRFERENRTQLALMAARWFDQAN